jgi:hypothetical protein
VRRVDWVKFFWILETWDTGQEAELHESVLVMHVCSPYGGCVSANNPQGCIVT